jgi:hypothetical protein
MRARESVKTNGVSCLIFGATHRPPHPKRKIAVHDPMTFDNNCQARKILASNRDQQKDALDKLKEEISLREANSSRSVQTKIYRATINLIMSMP